MISDTRALAEALESNTSHHKIQALTSSKSWKGASPKDMMERWSIRLETDKNTIRSMTQLCVKGADPTLNRRFNNSNWMLWYPRITSDVFMDNLFSSKKSGKSSGGYPCCQVFATPFGNVMGIPMVDKKGNNVANAMKIYFKEICVPPYMISDGARKQVQGESITITT